MENLMDRIIEWGALYGTKIIGAVAILVLGRIAVGITARLVKKLLIKADTDETLAKFVVSLARILLMTFVIIAALGTLGIQTASFIAVIGAAGLAIGFALQGSLANFASGVLLIMFKPFKVNEYVEAGGTAGIVEAIKIFHTQFKTPDNKKVIVPNSLVTGGIITNYSANETRRIDMIFGIGYGDDIKNARRILEEILGSDPRILKEPAASVSVLELADSSVNFAVRPWVKTGDYWPVYFAVTENVKMAFDREGVSIPFPQTDVHLHQANSV